MGNVGSAPPSLSPVAAGMLAVRAGVTAGARRHAAVLQRRERRGAGCRAPLARRALRRARPARDGRRASHRSPYASPYRTASSSALRAAPQLRATLRVLLRRRRRRCDRAPALPRCAPPPEPRGARRRGLRRRRRLPRPARGCGRRETLLHLDEQRRQPQLRVLHHLAPRQAACHALLAGPTARPC